MKWSILTKTIEVIKNELTCVQRNCCRVGMSVQSAIWFCRSKILLPHTSIALNCFRMKSKNLEVRKTNHSLQPQIFGRNFLEKKFRERLFDCAGKNGKEY